MYALAMASGLRPPTALQQHEYFARLIRAVVGQQLSVKAAASIYARLSTLAGKLTPENLVALSHDELRGAGLSNAKASYVHEISRAVLEREVLLEKLHELEDAAVIAELTQLKGIGPWSAEMFLIFTLGRPDVFSHGDLGLKNAILRHYGKLPEPKLQKLVLSWSPHRSTAAHVLWHSLDNTPK